MKSHEQDRQWVDSQDAVIAAPESHIVVFEDEDVRVVKVIIPPLRKEPMHTHKWPSVMKVVSSTKIRYYDSQGNAAEYPARDASPEDPFIELMEPEGLHAVENLDPERTYKAIRVELKTSSSEEFQK